MVLSFVAGSTALVGCPHVVKSVHTTELTGQGLLYGLPKAQILITAHRRQGTSEKLTQLRTEASAAYKKMVEANAAVEVAGTKKEKTKASVEAKKAQQIYKALDNEVNNLAKTLWAEEAQAKILPSIPDPQARYRALLDHWGNRDDDLNLTVTNGLLSSTELSSTDKFPEIVVSLAEAAALLATPFPTRGASSFLTEKILAGAVCEPYEFSIVIDPTSKEEWNKLAKTWPKNSAFAVEGVVSNVAMPPVPSPVLAVVPLPETQTSATKEDDQNKGKGQDDDHAEGLHYRALVPVAITFKPDGDRTALMNRTNCQLDNLPQATTMTALVPDNQTDFALAVDAGPFVSTKFTYKFKDGVPTDYYINRPSEILAVATLPTTIMRGMLSTVTEVFKLKIDQDTQATALVKGQADMAQAAFNAQAQKLKNETAILTDETARITAETAKIQAEKAYKEAVDAKAKAEAASAVAGQ
jgi:hypothetical protein